MPTTAYRTTLSLLALAAASPALAQQADGDYSITVIGDRLAAEDTNASWSVIDEQDLNRAQNGAAADLLARLPGVAITHYGTLGGVTNLRIRGAEGEQKLGAIDGVRVGDSPSPGGGFALATLLRGGLPLTDFLRHPKNIPLGGNA